MSSFLIPSVKLFLNAITPRVDIDIDEKRGNEVHQMSADFIS